MIQTRTKSPKSNVPAERTKIERTTPAYQIPRYIVRIGGKFPGVWLAGTFAAVLLGTELALYLSPDISRPYALLLTLVRRR